MDDLTRLNELYEKVKYHNDLFFKQNRSEISDADFDILFKEYKDLCDTYPDHVSSIIEGNSNFPLTNETTELKQVRFKIPMMSLDKCLDLDSYMKFVERVKGEEDGEDFFDFEYKLDGLALEATYVFGKLTELKTRFDGVNGESVIHNLGLFNGTLPRTVDGFVSLPEVFVRGEAYITIENFDKYNNLAEKKMKNPRNMVAGLVRRSSGGVTSLTESLLDYNVYWCDNTFELETYSEVKDKLKELGFIPPPAATQDDIINNNRHGLVPIDGIVIKINNLKKQQDLGERGNTPRWATSYKFPAFGGVTALNSVQWQMSASGSLTPVGNFAPVEIGGVTVTNATLFNYRTFAKKQLKEGAVVEITRNGDVIPYINKVIENGKGRLLKIPQSCPSCGLQLIFTGSDGEEVNLVCNNHADCPGQLSYRIEEYLGKYGLKVDGVGIKTIDSWVKVGHVKKLTDIYTVNKLILGESSYDKIHSVKTVEVAKLLKGLSLRGVGVETAKEIANLTNEHSISTGVSLKEALFEVLTDVVLLTGHNVQSGTALELAKQFTSGPRLEELMELTDILHITHSEEDKVVGPKVYLTGTTNISRKELEMKLREMDIELSEKFNKSVSLLLVGEKPGQTKIDQAKKRGIDVLHLVDVEDILKTIKETLS